MRFDSFIKATTKKTAVKLSFLVPTIGALNEHIKRVYLQTQLWLGNKTLNPVDWGWCSIEGELQPLKTPDQPAPEQLLKMIFCNCKKGCGSTCGCRRVGLFCNSACINCNGDTCQNRFPVMDQEEDEEEDENVLEKDRDEREVEDDSEEEN